MKIIQYVRAFAAIEGLMGKECGYQTAFDLLHVRNELKEKAEFFAAEELKIIGKYAVRDNDGKIIITDGKKFEFVSEDAMQEYLKDMDALYNVEVEDFSSRTITPPVCISPAAIEALEGFIEFRGE